MNTLHYATPRVHILFARLQTAHPILRHPTSPVHHPTHPTHHDAYTAYISRSHSTAKNIMTVCPPHLAHVARDDGKDSRLDGALIQAGLPAYHYTHLK